MSDESNPLRPKLEEAIETNKALTEQLAAATASNVIRDQGLDLVKTEDLAGIAIEEIPDRAKALQQERFDTQRDLLKDVLRRNGTPESDLDSTAEAMLKGEASTSGTSVDDGWQRLGGLQGAGAPTPAVDLSTLHGNDALTFGLEQAERRRASK